MLKRIILLAAMVVFLAGCKLGSGGGSSFSSLFDSGSGSIGGSSGSSSSFASSGSGGSIVSAGTPEPSTLALLGVGLAGLVATMLRKKKR